MIELERATPMVDTIEHGDWFKRSPGPVAAQSIDDRYRYAKVALEIGFEELAEQIRLPDAKQVLDRIREQAKGLVPYSYEWSILQIAGQTFFEGFDLNELLRDPQKVYEYRPITQWYQLPENFDRRAMAVVATRGETVQFDPRPVREMDPQLLASILSGRHPDAGLPPELLQAPINPITPGNIPEGDADITGPTVTPRTVDLGDSVPLVQSTRRGAPPSVRISELNYNLIRAANPYMNPTKRAIQQTPVGQNLWSDEYSVLRQMMRNTTLFNFGHGRMVSLVSEGGVHYYVELPDSLSVSESEYETLRKHAKRNWGLDDKPGQPLHGRPFSGGARENQKFLDNYRTAYERAFENKPNAPKLMLVALPVHTEFQAQHGTARSMWEFYKKRYIPYAMSWIATQAVTLAENGFHLEFVAREMIIEQSDGSREKYYALFPVMVRQQGNDREVVPFLFPYNTSQAGEQISVWGYLFSKNQVNSGSSLFTAWLRFMGIDPKSVQGEGLKRVENAAARLNEWLANQRRNGYNPLPVIQVSLVESALL